MTQHSDKILRNKMSEASPDELMHGFDEDIIWQQIQQKTMQQTAKKVDLYWPYAAVLAIGLFLGFCLNNSKTKETIYAQKESSKQTTIDTVYLPNPTHQTPATIAAIPAKKVTQPQEKTRIIIEPKQEVQMPLVHESIVEPPSGKDIIPVAEMKEIAVVYFEDLKGMKENKNHTAVKKKRRKLIELNKSNESESTSQELPIRNLLFASNK